MALGAQYGFKLGQRDAFVRADWEYQSRNPWLSALQDPRNTAQYNPFTYTLASTTFTSARAGVYLGDWQLALFIDNLFDSHRGDWLRVGTARPGSPRCRRTTTPSARVPSASMRPGTWGRGTRAQDA